MRFLDRMAVQIDEHGREEAPIAYRTPPQRHAGCPTRPDCDETVAIGNRFFRVLRARDGGREIKLRPWLEELASDAGNHTLPENDRRRVLPDPLGLRKIADLQVPIQQHPRENDDEHLWPSKRIDEIALRRIVHNFHDQDTLSVARAATRLAIVENRIFAESGAPVWRLRLIGYPDGRTQRVRLEIASHREVCEHSGGPWAALVPFADFRLHKLDRTDDLIEEIRHLDHYCAPDGVAEALKFAHSASVDITGAGNPTLDLTTSMLADLAARTYNMAVKLSAQTKEGELFVTLAQAMQGYEPPRRGAHAVEIAACLRDLHARLTDRTVRQPPDGSLNRHLNAIPPALRRLDHDLAEGLVEAPALDGADDEAIGALS